jgi:hypothetical protein
MTRSHLTPIVLAALCWPLLAGCPAAHRPIVQPVAQSSDLPVRRVVLFQNGVAYLERRGEFLGDELRLAVKPSQIRDLLKSITVVDFSGGHARSLALPVDVGSTKALSELPRLELGQGALGEILRVLRGARVRIATDAETTEGRLVGLDDAGGEAGQQVSLLTESGDIRLFWRKDIRALTIQDAALSQGLVKGLDISLGQDAWRSVELVIYLDRERAQQKRDLLVSYLVEMPTWKSSYRLVLDEQGDPLLQGWAIVDNVSGADWKDVKLTLTTGSPVSFHYDLYSPRFVARPDLTPYHTLGIAPPVAQSAAVLPPPPPPRPASSPAPPASMTGRSRAASAPREKTRAEVATGRSAGLLGDMDEDARDQLEEADSFVDASAMMGSVQVQASAQKVGSLYRFDLAHPMTVPNRSSTMLALINTRVPGQAIYTFNPGSGAEAARRHPFRAVRIRNQSGSVLEPGPIGIIRGGAFVGEGLIERIEKGQESYVAYALDTAVQVTHSQRGETELAGLVKISRGVVETRTLQVQRHVWEVQASAEDGEALPLMVSLPKRPGWSVEVEGGKQESETAQAAYYSLAVKPGEKTRLEVRETYPRSSAYRIGDHAAQQAILLYIEGKAARPEVVEKLRPVVERVRRLAEINARIALVEQKRGDLRARADEVRQNVRLLQKSRNLKLKNEQTQRLMALDRDLSRLTDEVVSLRDQAAELNVELSTQVESLELAL